MCSRILPLSVYCRSCTLFKIQIRTEKMIEKKHGLEPCQEVDLEEENDVLLNNLSLDTL